MTQREGPILIVDDDLDIRETLTEILEDRGFDVITASNGAVPFGFAITQSGTVVVSEAGAGSVSSYREGAAGAMTTITASSPVGQGAPDGHRRQQQQPDLEP